MAKLESAFQKELTDEIKRIFPGCKVIKNDSGYIQGFPDWTVLYRDRWAVFECKRYEGAPYQPNQEYYIEQLDDMSFSRCVYPENKEWFLDELYEHFTH